ncbi:hypothetical protein BW687_025265 [Pseudomonas graminis]|uniref:hypothetical protein n=1 Tax=Pseudomonas graminis TaxID=158627 RepID=UPI00234904C1|nr:hypothetical protein [Pseudomonas graminis]MDC6383480.1 hypothetical protein [Pseudomonas graminis]
MYALKIGHFPQGLALGDGLLFLIAAACFGFVYVMFAICMGSIGIFFSPLIRGIIHLLAWIVFKVTKSEKAIKYQLAPFHWISIPFAGIGGLLIFWMGKRDPVAYMNLPLLPIAIYLFYSIARSSGADYRREDRLARATIVTTESERLAHANKADNNKTAYFASVSVLIFLPLLFGGVTGQLTDGAMRLAQVRVEKAMVYVKAPYSTLLPADLNAADIQAPEGYKAFRDVTVLFQGFGTTTAIGFKDKDRSRQVDLPNDSLIVEKEPKKLSGDAS